VFQRVYDEDETANTASKKDEQTTVNKKIVFN
jgi:hypothetical protein